MINFPCPHCGATIKAQAEHAGRIAKCAHCGGRILVPEDQEAAGQLEAPPVQAAAQFDPADAVAELEQHALPPELPSRSPLNLQPCQDCGELISMRALACPRCGCPFEKVPPPAPKILWKGATLQRFVWSWISGIIGSVGIIYFAVYFDTTFRAENGDRIHNVGLMNDRLVGVIVFASIAVRAWIPDYFTFGQTTSEWTMDRRK